MEGSLNPENDPDFLEAYMRQMMSSLEGLKSKVNELNLEEDKEEDGERGRTRRKSILKKTQQQESKGRNSIEGSRNSSEESEVRVVRKNRGRSKRKRRSRDRSSGRRSRSRSKGRSTSSSCDEVVVKKEGSKRRKSRARKRSAKEDKEEIEKLIGEVLKKSNSCTEVINRGGRVRVHVEGYPTIVLQGNEKKKEKRGESKKRGGSKKRKAQSTDDYDSERS